SCDLPFLAMMAFVSSLLSDAPQKNSKTDFLSFSTSFHFFFVFCCSECHRKPFYPGVFERRQVLLLLLLLILLFFFFFLKGQIGQPLSPLKQFYQIRYLFVVFVLLLKSPSKYLLS